MAIRSTEAASNGTNPTSPTDPASQAGAAGWREPRVFTSAFRDRLPPGTPGTGSNWRWLFSGIWLIYLIQPVIDLFHHGGALWIAGGLVIVVAFCGIYMPTLMYHDDRPRLALAGLVAIALLAVLACVVYGKDWTPLWIYVSAASGMVLASVASRERAFLAVLGVSAAYLVCCWISHLDIGTTLAVLLPVVLIGLAMIGFRM